ncbi:TPA: transporter, partial [Streptococcus equi subsp. zooepidemicus]|nr:transporter [Streptococcus equi subsp. zooepidemicus]
MINEIIIQLPKKDNHIWLLHLWEHCVVRNFEHKLIQYGLDDQGIIVNGSTFLDSTTIEIYYSINDLKDNILSIVRKVIKDIPVDMIKREISI